MSTPRTYPDGRLPSGLVLESLERDLGASDSQTGSRLQFSSDSQTALTVVYGETVVSGISTLEICGPAVVTNPSPGLVHIDIVLPIQTLELVAQSAGADELVRQSIVPYDVSWATQYRYVVAQSNINGAVLQARYHDGTSWQNVGTDFTTGAASALPYVSPWQDIPGAWKAIGEAFVQVLAANEPDTGCDMPYVALQFRRSCSVCGVLSVAPSCGESHITNTGTIGTSPGDFDITPIIPPLP